MGYEGRFITMKLIWHNYLVLSLGNCAHETPTETGLRLPDGKIRLTFMQMDVHT